MGLNNLLKERDDKIIHLHSVLGNLQEEKDTLGKRLAKT